MRSIVTQVTTSPMLTLFAKLQITEEGILLVNDDDSDEDEQSDQFVTEKLNLRLSSWRNFDSTRDQIEQLPFQTFFWAEYFNILTFKALLFHFICTASSTLTSSGFVTFVLGAFGAFGYKWKDGRMEKAVTKLKSTAIPSNVLQKNCNSLFLSVIENLV